MNDINKNELSFKIQEYQKGIRSDIEEFKIIDFTFENIKFEYSGLRKNLFENCVFENVIFYEIYASESVFKDCIFKNCEFVAIDFGLSDIIFENTIFYKTKFRKTDTINCSFLNTSFIMCNFGYLDVSGNLFKGCRFIEGNIDGLIYSPKTFDKSNIFISKSIDGSG